MSDDEMETPLHWSTMLGWMTLILGRALQLCRSGVDPNEAIERAVRVSKAIPAIEIASRLAFRMLVEPVTDPAEVRMWIAAISPEAKVEGVAKA